MRRTSYANQHSFCASWLPRFPPSFPAKTRKPDTRWSVFVSSLQKDLGIVNSSKSGEDRP